MISTKATFNNTIEQRVAHNCRAQQRKHTGQTNSKSLKRAVAVSFHAARMRTVREFVKKLCKIHACAYLKNTCFLFFPL